MGNAGIQDWVFWISGALLALGGVVLALWALFWDRSRVRKRCPKCWYDMSAAVLVERHGGEGFGCPECGRRSTSKELLRTRRYWRWSMVGALLLVISYPLARYPLIRDHGWRRAIPTVVLLTVWPVDIGEWLRLNWPGATMEEVEARLGAGSYGASRLPERLERLWIWRVRRWAKSEGLLWNPQGGIAGQERAVLFVDASLLFNFDPLDTAVALPSMRKSRADEWQTVGEEAMFMLRDVLMQIVDAEEWVDNGGDGATLGICGRTLVVHARPVSTGRCSALLEAVRLAGHTPGLRAGASEYAFSDRGRDVRVYNVSKIMARLWEASRASGKPAYRENVWHALLSRIQLSVDPDSWVDNGGEVGSMNLLHPFGLLVIKQTSAAHARIADLLDEYERRAANDREAIRLLDDEG